jgi:hypothetical protein
MKKYLHALLLSLAVITPCLAEDGDADFTDHDAYACTDDAVRSDVRGLVEGAGKQLLYVKGFQELSRTKNRLVCRGKVVTTIGGFMADVAFFNQDGNQLVKIVNIRPSN